MRGADIRVGGTYLAKVSGRIVPLRVLAAGEVHAGPHAARRARTAWQCLNTVTQREILVRSPQRFRGAVEVMEPKP